MNAPKCPSIWFVAGMSIGVSVELSAIWAGIALLLYPSDLSLRTRLVVAAVMTAFHFGNPIGTSITKAWKEGITRREHRINGV